MKIDFKHYFIPCEYTNVDGKYSLKVGLSLYLLNVSLKLLCLIYDVCVLSAKSGKVDILTSLFF